MPDTNLTSPISLFCAAAPSDTALLSQWETHLLPLQQSGHITVWSELHLAAGASRMEQILSHLDQAQVILFLLSSAFFASDECMALVKRPRIGSARVLLLLLRPVDWKTPELGNLTCLPANGSFVTAWPSQDEALHTCVYELRRRLRLPAGVPPQSRRGTPTMAQQNRERMLARLHHAYTELMSQTLQGAVWLELGLASKPNAVQNAMRVLLRVKGTEQPLPPGTSIIQAYDKAEHELLILGEPGAGKSTLLLDLARQLVERAQADETHPMPVILPLSTWASTRGSLADWIAEQVSEIYDVPGGVCTEWVQQGSILPLLDGLDEMEEAARPDCMNAINTYKRGRLAPLVVCSRATEYEAVPLRHRLALQRAIVVQPLLHEAVDISLSAMGEPLIPLRDALCHNGALRDLATTPLMLNILILTYQGTRVHDLPKKDMALLQRVWDDYIERMAMRKGNSARYPLKQTRRWLSFLARQMRDHNQTIFYLEHLQPDWLEAQPRCTYTKLAVRGPSLIIGVLISILVSLFLISNPNPYYLLLHGLMGGLMGGFWYDPTNAAKRRAHPSTWTKNLLKRMALSICIGLISGLSFAFTNESRVWFISFGIAMAAGSLLLQYLLAAPLPSRPSLENTAERRWQRVLRFWHAVQGPRVLLVAIITSLSYELAWELAIALSSSGLRGALNPSILTFGVMFSLMFGLSLGLSFTLINLILGTHMGDIHLTERMGWNWRGLFNTRHLRITSLLTSISIIVVGLGFGLPIGLTRGLISGLSIWLVDGLSYGLSVALSCWFLLGLVQCLAQERIEDQDRQVANEGIHRSLRNSVVICIIGGVIFGCIGLLNYGLGAGLSAWLNAWLNAGVRYRLDGGLIQAPGMGFLIGLIGALFLWIVTGGLATFRHYIIRFLLSHSRIFPMLAPKFLDDAVARFLLRRVGGGYTFAHRLLLDYLADTGKLSTEQASASMEATPSPPA